MDCSGWNPPCLNKRMRKREGAIMATSSLFPCPQLHINGVACFGMLPALTREDDTAVLEQLPPQARISFIGLPPSHEVCQLVSRLALTRHLIHDFVFVGWHNTDFAERISNLATHTLIDDGKRFSDAIELMRERAQKLKGPIDCLFFHNSPAGLLQALKRLGISYAGVQRDVFQLLNNKMSGLTDNGLTIAAACEYIPPAFSYFPADHILRTQDVMQRFTDGLLLGDMGALPTDARVELKAAQWNAAQAAGAVQLEPGRIAFSDLDAFFQRRKSVDTEHWKRELHKRFGPVLFCSTGKGRLYRGHEIEALVIIQLPGEWRGKVDLESFVDSRLSGHHKPHYLQLQRHSYDVFKTAWLANLPAIVRNYGKRH